VSLPRDGVVSGVLRVVVMFPVAFNDCYLLVHVVAVLTLPFQGKKAYLGKPLDQLPFGSGPIMGLIEIRDASFCLGTAALYQVESGFMSPPSTTVPC